MSANAHGRIGSLVRTCLCFSILIVTLAERECDQTKCPGPLVYYKDLQCTPIYKRPDDCCAIKYNCERLGNLSAKKCYAKGHEYEIGERIREEDANPCDVECTCTEGHRGIAKFTCAIVDCFDSPSPGCYLKLSHNSCCGGPEVCPYREPKLATCLVDGKMYTDGQYFQPKSDQDKDCICMPGYAGKHVEPFCVTRKSSVCDVAFYHPLDIHDKCAPVYYHAQDPATSCSVFARCQNANDTVIPVSNSSEPLHRAQTDGMACKFGNLTMKLGDRLDSATDYASVCVKCVCEVPPVPTCQRLSDTECDVTVHPAFD